MNEGNTVIFDLSLLNLHELIDVYENITDFIEYLDKNIIVDRKKENG